MGTERKGNRRLGAAVGRVGEGGGPSAPLPARPGLGHGARWPRRARGLALRRRPSPSPSPPPPAYSLPTSLAALGRRVRRNAPLATLPANYPWLLVFALLSAFLVWAPSALPGALGLGYAVGLTFKEARGATRAYWAWEAAERKRREDEARRDAEGAQSEQEGGGRVAGEAQDGGTGALGRGQGAGASGRRPPESRGAETEGSASEGPSDPPPASLASPTAPRAPPPVLNAYYGRASPSDPRSLALFSGPGEELVPWRAIAACFGTYALLRGGEKLPAAVAGWFVAASAVALHLILRTEGWAGERAREGAGATNVRGDPAGSAKPTSSAASSGLPAADAPAPSSPSASSSFSLSAPFATRSPRVTAARPSAPAPVPPASDYIALSDLFELSSTPRRPDRFALFAEVDAAVRADLARRLERASGAADEWLAWARVRIRQWLDRKRLERAVLDAI